MNKASISFIVIALLLGWLVFQYYGRPVAQTFLDDVQAYQKKSLLPEDS